MALFLEKIRIEYIGRMVEIFNSRRESSWHRRAYEDCKPELPPGTSYPEFLEKTAGADPGKSGLGEKKQFKTLYKRFLCIEKLPTSGNNTISIYKDND